jgi:hypothetical protein
MILYVVVFEKYTLQNNFAKKVQQNFAEFHKISWNYYHFRRYFVFRKIKKSYFMTTLPRVLCGIAHDQRRDPKTPRK